MAELHFAAAKVTLSYLYVNVCLYKNVINFITQRVCLRLKLHKIRPFSERSSCLPPKKTTKMIGKRTTKRRKRNKLEDERTEREHTLKFHRNF